MKLSTIEKIKSAKFRHRLFLLLESLRKGVSESRFKTQTITIGLSHNLSTIYITGGKGDFSNESGVTAEFLISDRSSSVSIINYLTLMFEQKIKAMNNDRCTTKNTD